MKYGLSYDKTICILRVYCGQTQKQRQFDITSSCLCYGRAKGFIPFMLLCCAALIDAD